MASLSTLDFTQGLIAIHLCNIALLHMEKFYMNSRISYFLFYIF